MRGLSEEKGLFPPFLGLSRCSSGLRKRAKKERNGRERPISADFREARPDTPIFTLPFAAARSSGRVWVVGSLALCVLQTLSNRQAAGSKGGGETEFQPPGRARAVPSESASNSLARDLVSDDMRFQSRRYMNE